MPPLRPTMRRSGKKHATIRLTFHPDRSDVQYFLAAKAINGEVELDTNTTKKYVEEAVREAYMSHGQDAAMAAGDRLYDKDNGELDGEEYIAWADAQLVRLYPDWK